MKASRGIRYNLALVVNSKDRGKRRARIGSPFLIVGAFNFWIIGIGAVSDRFARNLGLDRYYYQITDFPNVRLSIVNVVPGLYYLLLCPLDLVPEFPFVRVAWRLLFDSLVNLPPRCLLEPTSRLLGVSPGAGIAIFTPFCRTRLAEGVEFLHSSPS